MAKRIDLPVNISVERAVEALRLRFGSFPSCQSWPELQRACEQEGIEIGPDRTYVDEQLGS